MPDIQFIIIEFVNLQRYKIKTINQTKFIQIQKLNATFLCGKRHKPKLTYLEQ